MLDCKNIYRLLSEYPECRDVLQKHENNNEMAFQKLISLKGKVPKELYGICLHIMYRDDTDEVSIDTLIEAFQDVDREDIMSEKDLKEYESFLDKITIYRGTDDFDEKKPRISWSLNKEIAENFATAHMFKAIIAKSDVIAYFCENSDEHEIIAVVNNNFEIIY